MAAMSQTWSIFTAVLVIQLCTGEKSCVIWSTAGSVVQRGSTFKVYCTFKCKGKGSMYSDHPPKLQSHEKFNSTTIYLNVVNITKNRTYSCQCACPLALDPCGLDISAGYLPDQPKNISCINKVISNESGVVFCTWNQGRNTYLRNSSELRVRTLSGNHTVRPLTRSGIRKGTDLLSASFTVSSSVQLISVWVQAQNSLGFAVSLPINYTLSDIATPSAPDLSQPSCSSRECIIQVKQSVKTQNLEIQYSSEAQMWTSYPDSGVQMSSVQVWSISSLEPYRWYHFRARSKFSRGLWSEWSANVSGQTQEEAPGKELDVWCAEPVSDFKSRRIYWKGADISNTRGKITQYIVSVYSQNAGLVFSANISADVRNYSVPFCSDCEVTVWSCNSKGLSPPATVLTHHIEAKALEVVQVPASNHSVTISWRKPDTARQHRAHVVEWYPEGHKLEELRWVRLGWNDSQAVITGIKPFECYEGAVYVVYADSSMSRTRFTGVTTTETVPAAVPSVQEKVEGNKVKVSWMEIPRGQRGGCITSYTIYLESGSGDHQAYSIPASERMHIINDLLPATYSLWVTASTAIGEGPTGQRSKVKFFIQEETQLTIPIVCVVISLITLFLMCLYQSSTVKQRFWAFFHCIMPNNVPDPANSKWAKECTQERGKMNLQLQLSNCNVTKEEEKEPVLVDVEELPTQSCDTSSQLLPQTSLDLPTEPDVLLYPLTTYIKTFSHDSDSSNHTQCSLDMTSDYISSHRPAHTGEEDYEDEDDALGFFPSHTIFIEPLEFGGKLTLDAVKIDCGDFFQNSNF